MNNESALAGLEQICVFVMQIRSLGYTLGVQRGLTGAAGTLAFAVPRGELGVERTLPVPAGGLLACLASRNESKALTQSLALVEHASVTGGFSNFGAVGPLRETGSRPENNECSDDRDSNKTGH
jgi:hypothetical protein